MNGWMILWTTVLFGALTLFSGLALVVTIGGFLDIRKMLSELRRQHALTPNDPASPPHSGT